MCAGQHQLSPPPPHPFPDSAPPPSVKEESEHIQMENIVHCDQCFVSSPCKQLHWPANRNMQLQQIRTQSPPVMSQDIACDQWPFSYTFSNFTTKKSLCDCTVNAFLCNTLIEWQRIQNKALHVHTHTQFTIQRETLYILHEPPDLEPDTALPGQGGKEGEMGEGRLQGGERPRNQLGWGRRVKSSLTLCSLTCCMAEDSPCLVHFMAVDKLSRASHDSFLELSWLIVRNSDFV